MNSSAEKNLHELLSAVVDGTARNEQIGELATILESDAEARRFYVHYLDMNATLIAAASRETPRRGWRVPWVAVVASFMAASLLLAWLVVPRGQREGDPEQIAVEDVETASAVTYVGTVASASDDATLNGERVSTGERLTVGAYRVAGQSVTVQFDGGARVLFAGQAQFALRSRRAMAIDRGTFVFQGDQTCESIEIATPHSVFKNIGTRYAAVIDDRSEEVHVAEGAVRRTTGDDARQAEHELIEAGAGRRYDAQGGTRMRKAIPLDVTLVARPLTDKPVETVAVRPAAVDDFRGEAEHLHGMRSGYGWTEPWRSPGRLLRLVSPGLTGDASVAVLHDGSGGDASTRRSAAHRQLETPIDLSQDRIWYLRILIRRGRAVPKDEHRAMIVLRKRGLSLEDEAEQNALIQIALRKDDTAMVRLADTLTRVSLPQAPGQTYAVIVKIVSGRVKPEQVLVRLMAADRLADAEEPSEWSLVSDSVDTDLRFDLVSLECVSRGRIEFGDLVIGPTWQSVVAVPVPR
jgi:hypothetical protein